MSTHTHTHLLYVLSLIYVGGTSSVGWYVPNRHVVEIMWITSTACNAKGSTALKSETKCFNVHLVHNNGLKAAYIDLSGLIKDSGYSATSSKQPDLRVSVCRQMHTKDGCDGSMACLVSGDKELTVKSKHFGIVQMLTVEYPISRTSVKGCNKPIRYSSSVLQEMR